MNKLLILLAILPFAAACGSFDLFGPTWPQQEASPVHSGAAGDTGIPGWESVSSQGVVSLNGRYAASGYVQIVPFDSFAVDPVAFAAGRYLAGGLAPDTLCAQTALAVWVTDELDATIAADTVSLGSCGPHYLNVDLR